MRGDADVINTLNDLLAGELTAIDQYFLHSRMYENWGYAKLYERIEHERQDETGHAAALIKRILFLEGTPVLDKRDALRIGRTVPEMLRNDLDLELEVVADLRMAIALCEQKGDFVTREILEQMLDDTEQDHAYWLEIQLRLIDQVGLQNYLQSQMS
jgi:bacterioferritin